MKRLLTNTKSCVLHIEPGSDNLFLAVPSVLCISEELLPNDLQRRHNWERMTKTADILSRHRVKVDETFALRQSYSLSR